MTYQEPWHGRDDHVEGTIYLITCDRIGLTIFGFRVWGTYKIGLTRNLHARIHDGLAGAQPPCNYYVVAAIRVQDMAIVETHLHETFKRHSIRLQRSKEWFDLPFWTVWRVKWEYSRIVRHADLGLKQTDHSYPDQYHISHLNKREKTPSKPKSNNVRLRVRPASSINPLAVAVVLAIAFCFVQILRPYFGSTPRSQPSSEKVLPSN